MFELLFLMSFTLHNIEESIWLPKWSKNARKYHPTVENNEFHFAVLVITVIGYILTFLFVIYGSHNLFIKYLYLGFIFFMCFNAIFPHLIATIFLKKYAPGTLTGLILNVPIGLYIIFIKYGNKLDISKLLFSFFIIIVIALILLKQLFRLGKKLIDSY